VGALCPLPSIAIRPLVLVAPATVLKLHWKGLRITDAGDPNASDEIRDLIRRVVW
jgi:hypothetical protein